jgi:hypothetical protein
MTSSTQTIYLEPLTRTGVVDSESVQQIKQTSDFDPAHGDTVIAESRLADAAAPDGGYGWVIIGACSVLTFWFVGTSYSWGVIQAALVEENLSSPASLSFVGSLTAACISFFALVNARLIRRIGGRRTALLGVGFLGLGEVLSGFSTRNVGALFFTAGVLMGIGCSCCFMVRFFVKFTTTANKADTAYR